MYPPSSEKEPTFSILSARSPDGRYNLIFDWYIVIEESGGEVDISGEPDSAPLLLDLRHKTSNEFEFVGPSGRFDWGVWLSPTAFALAGSNSVDNLGRWRQGTIGVYSITDSTVTTYVTPAVSGGRSSNYRTAWESWVSSKFRALKHPS
ncbi:MAG TPA: hypothetical protein VKL61_00460 [Candidatus Polarisedimenticolia bacterium]|nr:hypothetical protein [Candidatus Polarisedimenticolia bacterium]